MPQLKNRNPELFTVRRAVLNTSTDPRDMSPLGRELMKLAAEIDASDDPAMSEEDFERELQIRRGGFIRDEE